MAAIIQSEILAKPTLQGQSREDLRAGDVVTLTSVTQTHATYTWTITAAPEALDGTPSAAVLTAPASVTTDFTADNPGAYIIRLVVDAGIPATESTQFVRLRYLTQFADLKLVGAGERRDQTAVIPVDASAEGWANDQNYNLQQVEALLARISTSGRTFYVDANRGMDNTNPQNDSTIAEDYADYSSINSAIVAAVNTAPAPSEDNPFVIKVHPGLYEEDISFAPHVHVMGLSVGGHKSEDRSVVVQAASLHDATLTNGSDTCFVSGVHFETLITTTDAVIYKTGLGTLVLDNCTVTQTGDSPTQGPCVYQDLGTFIARDSLFKYAGSNTTRVAFLQEADAVQASDSYFERCTLVGPCGVYLNPSDLPNGTARFVNCFIESTLAHGTSFGLRSGIDYLTLEKSEVKVNGITNAVDIKKTTASHVHMWVTILWSNILGDISFDTTGISGTKALEWGSVNYNAFNLTGALTGGYPVALTQAATLFYDNTASGLTAEDVQAAIDEIAPALLTTLDIAYDGPLGSGHGKTIIADSGAVIIQDTGVPVPLPGIENGWLQVEGNIQSGGIGSPEVNIQPNPDSTGPVIALGQNSWPDIGASHRGAPSGTIRARSTGDPLHHNYNLRLETESTWGASNGEVGRVLIKAGDAASYNTAPIPSPPDAGSVHIQGGTARYDNTQVPGSIFLAPGFNSIGPTQEGYVTLVNPAGSGGLAGSDPATLAAANPLGVGTVGVTGNITFYVGGVGTQTVSIDSADNLAAVNAKLNTLVGVDCSVGLALDPITLSTDAVGPNAEILFAFDDQNGDLNLALGDFSVSGGATFTPGSYIETVDVGCSAADTFQIYGDLIVDGTATFIGGGAIHAASHVFGGVTDVIDGDGLDITWAAYANYTPALVGGVTTSTQELTSHLAGIDAALGSVSVAAHATSHESGDSDPIDGDVLDIDYTPTNYTPTLVGGVTTSTQELTSHLAGIEVALHTYEVSSLVSGVLYLPSVTDHYIRVSTSLNPVTVQLPSAAPGNWAGRVIIIKDEGANASVNNITINSGGGAGAIDGAGSLPLNSNYASATLICDGSTPANWYII